MTEVAQGGGFRRPRQNIALPIYRAAKVDTDNPQRGPLSIISGEEDHTVPPAIATPPTSNSTTTKASPRSSRSRTGDMLSLLTAAGAKSPTPPLPSSNDSPSRP